MRTTFCLPFNDLSVIFDVDCAVVARWMPVSDIVALYMPDCLSDYQALWERGYCHKKSTEEKIRHDFRVTIYHYFSYFSVIECTLKKFDRQPVYGGPKMICTFVNWFDLVKGCIFHVKYPTTSRKSRWAWQLPGKIGDKFLREGGVCSLC
jgi:hypothetical protein